MLKTKQRPHIIGVRSTSKIYEPLLKKQFHKVIPLKYAHFFTDYVHKDKKVQWAHEDQCRMIFPAINEHGDYWCSHARDKKHADRYRQQYCKSCQKIIYEPYKPKKKDKNEKQT